MLFRSRYEALFTGGRDAAWLWWLRAGEALAELIFRFATLSSALPIDRAMRVAFARLAHRVALMVVESFNGNSIDDATNRATPGRVEA